MQRGYKIRLLPNNKQMTQLYAAASVARYAYNFALGFQQKHYKETGSFIYNGDMRKIITIKKKSGELAWLYNYSNNIVKQAVKDCEKAFINFFENKTKYPRFKSKKKNINKFYCDNVKTKIKGNKVLIEKIGWIKLAEAEYLPEEYKLLSVRISCDNGFWFASFGCEIEDVIPAKNIGENIGIDMGIKNFMVLSGGTVYKNINKEPSMKRKVKRYKRLQRKYQKGGCCANNTSNAVKLIKSMKKLRFRINNTKSDYVHKITTEIVKTKRPSVIVVEDLNITGMMKNKKLARAIGELSLYEAYRQLKYKSQLYGSEFIEADRWYPSSKKCCVCGKINHGLTLKDRTFICDCGNIRDRDDNASQNLKALAV